MRKLEVSTDTVEATRNLLNLAPLANDLIYSILGDPIGSGVYRSVFESKLNPKEVIKIESNNAFCNVQEFLIWDQMQSLCGPLAWVKDWFAPIKWISPGGHILCMQRTEERPGKKRPDEIPAFLWDVKQSNFGWIGNKFVCHDYASIYAFMDYKKKFKKVAYAWTNDA